MKYRIAAVQSIIILLFLYSCNFSRNVKQRIVLTNTSKIDLQDKAVAIKRESLKPSPDGYFPLITNENGDKIPCQPDDLDGDGSWDQLFFVNDIPAESTAVLSLKWIKNQPGYVIRTSVRFGKRSSENTSVLSRTSDTLFSDQVHRALGYQPYQTDGPSWENDRIGFRHYFDGRNANDLFGKKVSWMSPDTVGISSEGAVEDNYHVMADWGRDILSVGNSVGIGGFGLMIGDSIARLGITGADTLNNVEKSIFSILTEGPVHSVMHFQYQNWHAGDRVYQADEKTGIWPGMYAYKNTVKISGLQGDEMLLVGLVNSNTDHTLTELNTGNEFVMLYTHDRQTYDKVWYLGLALILPKDAYAGYGEAPEEGPFSKTFYGKLKIKENTPVSYYATGCWELSDEGFRDSTYFRNYIEDLARQLATDISISIE
ncbi:MAG: DUF4861 domain-containing protein [Bacteroidales bacterium]|nr:DUF4861 domain-containing protein [Bacteroidales bacterium]